MKPRISPAILFSVLISAPTPAVAHDAERADHWQPSTYEAARVHAPSPLPDRVVLTWSDDPVTSQSVTWRTDTSVRRGIAEIAIAGPNGRAMATRRVDAITQPFQSDLNAAHYHTLTFRDLSPDTLYAYRVGDGANWSEFFHFRTASKHPTPFRFVYFGDAQNDVKTHWSRVFREAFRDAPRAAFILHAGDLINEDASDAEWGEWHGAADWVNGTIPIIATPGNHEYRRVNAGPRSERFWRTADGSRIPVETQLASQPTQNGAKNYLISATFANGTEGRLTLDHGGLIQSADATVLRETGLTSESLLGTSFRSPPLRDERREPGDPMVSAHWRPQFEFPRQRVPNKALEETVYYIDYQGTRIISLDSNRDLKSQVPWLRRALAKNPNRWTIVTFHHPVFSPASNRDNPELRALWKPLLDRFRVDLVLSGHDHTYARTGALGDTNDRDNVPSGYQQAYDPDIGTVYVVSVSGPKMYQVTNGAFARRVAEDTQLYQVIDVADRTLSYTAYTATGELYDAFTLEKQDGDKPNRLHEVLPSERRRSAP